MSEAVELASCPFCGTAAHLDMIGRGGSRHAAVFCGDTLCGAVAHGCGATADLQRQAAIARWNRRFRTGEGEPVGSCAACHENAAELCRFCRTRPEGEPVEGGLNKNIAALVFGTEHTFGGAEGEPVAWPDREAVARAILAVVFERTQPNRGDVFGWLDDNITPIADAILALSASDGAGQVEGE